jgi:pimeloyl-ACP methyl ester carboxylesterase
MLNNITPATDNSYDTVEAVLTNPSDGTHLAGTLTLPTSAFPCPAVLLIPSSGKHDRDECINGQRPFSVWADALSNRGVAVLRMDDRGVGGSSGDKNQVTHETLLSDIYTAVDWLAKQQEVDAKRIGVMGHSEGGILAAAAGQCPAVSLAVLLATPGLPGESIIHTQAEAISRANDASEEAIAHEREMNRKVFAVLKADRSHDDILPNVVKTLKQSLLSWPGDAFDEESACFHARAMAGIVIAPVFRSFLRSDPAQLIRRITCPTLVLIGEKDIQVEPHANLAAIRAALNDSPSPLAQAEMVKGANHLLQDCESGTIEEYETIDHAVSPRVLRRVSDWIAQVWKMDHN